MKILATLQLPQHHDTFSPAGNLAAAVLNTRGLLYGGRDNSTYLLGGHGVGFLTPEVFTDKFGSSQLVSTFTAIIHCAFFGSG